MVDMPNLRQRASMLREVIFHQEAIAKFAFEFPPLRPGDHYPTYDEMMLDPTINYCINLIKDAVLAEQWLIEPSDVAGTGAAAMAVEIERNLKDVEPEDAIFRALNAIWRGFSAQEITWRHQQRHFWLDRLASVNANQIALELNDQMRIIRIISRPQTGGHVMKLDAEKLWFHRHNGSRTSPAGESMLEPVYRPWSTKNRLLQYWGQSIQRFGTPQWKITMPANTPPARRTSIMQGFYDARLDNVFVIPEDVVAEVVNPTQWANQLYENALDYADAQIVLAILQERQTPQGPRQRNITTGVRMDTQQRALNHRLTRISRKLCQSFNKQVIQPLCWANWRAKPETCPQLVLPLPDADRVALLAAPWQQIVQAGIADPATAAEQLGLPEPTPRPAEPAQKSSQP